MGSEIRLFLVNPDSSVYYDLREILNFSILVSSQVNIATNESYLQSV